MINYRIHNNKGKINKKLSFIEIDYVRIVNDAFANKTNIVAYFNIHPIRLQLKELVSLTAEIKNFKGEIVRDSTNPDGQPRWCFVT